MSTYSKLQTLQLTRKHFLEKKYFDNGIRYIRDVCNTGATYLSFHDFHTFFKANQIAFNIQDLFQQ